MGRFARHVWLLGGTALLVASGCDVLHSCTAMACGSPAAPVRLLDDSGSPVIARGEWRTGRGAELGPPQPFDCRGTVDAGAQPCIDGTLVLMEFNLTPSFVYELRFARADGSLTPWQAVPLELERVNDPDFNGPDCPCSWYEAKPVSVVVPVDAR